MIENPEDDLAVLRIINVPRRGIGAATINKVQDWEAEQGIRFYDALLEAEYVPGLMRSLNKIKSFTSFTGTPRESRLSVGQRAAE